MVDGRSGTVVDWLSVTQLSRILEIPETTTRRYLSHFEGYFRSEQIGRGKKYHPESIEILRMIANLYSVDRETIEIKGILAEQYAFTIEEDSQESATIKPPAYDLSGKFDRFQKRQEDFNRQLIEKIQEQQLYIKELIENQNNDIKNAQRLDSPEKKKEERFYQILAEHKVNKELEKEAINLWLEKPEEERLRKIGFFRKSEDIAKRDDFIKDYVEEHFEEYLKLELDI